MRKFFGSPLASVFWICGFAFGGVSIGGGQPFAVQGPGVNSEDFRVTTFASGLDYPLGMLELEDGSLLVMVSEGPSFFASTGKLIRLVDTDGDGVADGVPQVMLSGLPGSQTSLRSVGDLIFATGQRQPISVIRRGANPGDSLSVAGRIVVNYDAQWYHPTTALAVRKTPGKTDSYDLFFQLGSTENATVTTRKSTLSFDNISGTGGVLEGDALYMVTIVDHGDSLSGGGLRKVAAGLRNAAGIAVHPVTGDLYFQDNGIDGLTEANESHSADELNRIARADIGKLPPPHFGFPDSYIRYRTGEVVGGAGVQPLVAFHPLPDPTTGRESEGANEIAFAPPGFPEGLNTGIFVGFHGKFYGGGLANEENPVVYADPETGDYFHFILGQRVDWGHPDGLLATRDSLFVSDLATTGHLGNSPGSGVIYQIKSLVAPVPPEIAVKRTGRLIELRWDRGILQYADEPGGPWQEILDSFSPYLIEPAGARKFFRAAY